METSGDAASHRGFIEIFRCFAGGGYAERALRLRPDGEGSGRTERRLVWPGTASYRQA